MIFAIPKSPNLIIPSFIRNTLAVFKSLETKNQFKKNYFPFFTDEEYYLDECSKVRRPSAETS